MTSDRVKVAEFEVDRARGQLVATLEEISRQVQPHRLVQEAWEKAKDKGADMAENAVDAVSRRPVATGAVVAGIVAFLAREPLMGLAGKLVKRKKEKSPKRRPGRKTEGAARKENMEAQE